jgi:hypothetical protein
MAMSNTVAAVRRQGPMLWIIAWMIGLTLIYAPIRQAWDQHFLPRPWVSPVIEIVAEAEGKPSIRYGARPKVELTGNWTTWIEVNGRRSSTSKGEGHYMPGREPRMWEWGDWFGRDWPVPTRPFVACVSYDLRTTSGARGQFGPFCSEEFKP